MRWKLETRDHVFPTISAIPYPMHTTAPTAAGLTVVIGNFTTGSISQYADVLRETGFVDITDTGVDDAVLTDGTITIRLLFVQPDAFNIRIEPNR
jgi:hypothetical protein